MKPKTMKQLPHLLVFLTLSLMVTLSISKLYAAVTAPSNESHLRIENSTATQPQQSDQNNNEHGTHNHPTLYGNGTIEPHLSDPPSAETVPSDRQAGGHHHHRPAMLPPDEDKDYSELNHHIAGAFVLLAGGLAFITATGNARFSWARYGWPGLFLFLGIFLLARHDPESWPIGPLSLQESLSDPQIFQHVIFTFIILGIGVVEWLRCRGILSHRLWSLVFPALAVSATIMLFAHKHGEGVAADKIYRHHATMAVAGIIAMTTKVMGDTRLLNGKISNYLWSGLMMFIGIMLMNYSDG